MICSRCLTLVRPDEPVEHHGLEVSHLDGPICTQRLAEVEALNLIGQRLEEEWQNTQFTASQRLTALSEMRKVVATRAAITGVLQPVYPA